MGKISGPLMDRIDIHIEVPAVPFEELSASSVAGTSSQQMRDDVVTARATTSTAFRRRPDSLQRTDEQPTSPRVLQAGHACQQMLRHSVEDMGLSARAHDKILRVARTIADVAGDESIDEMHLAEAIGSAMTTSTKCTSPKQSAIDRSIEICGYRMLGDFNKRGLASLTRFS